MTGFDLPDTGAVALDEHEITRWPVARRAREGLARTFQHGHLFKGLSVRENVEVAALGVGRSARAGRRRARELLGLLGLQERAEQDAGLLPHGEEMKLGVARALATEPRYVLMDEPAAGLSDSEVPAFADVLRSVRDKHDAGVLVIDHNMSLIMGVCDRVYVLDEGKLIAHGPPDEVRRDVRVAAAYLGAGRG
jgi:branched-chain amino acid transport system ATP-binding protein